jgi:tRNA dimethylallyltransferase
MATSVNNELNTKNTQFSTTNEAPLIVVVGPTASGKSAVAMRLAKALNGEIICADSRTIYTYMDIGTTKPSAQDRAEVPHWGLDLVEPGEVFTAADFKQYAIKKIAEIRKRGHVPLLVGGSGLYVDGVIFDYTFAQSSPERRAQLEKLTLEELKEYCANNNISLPENDQNRRYVIRAIERQNNQTTRLSEPIDNTVIVGIATNRDVLRRRIEARSEQLFEQGMVEEAILLGKKYGWNSEAMTGNIYKLVKQYMDGQLTSDELKQKNITADWQLAKRQLTWFKRNPFIRWLPLNDVYKYIEDRLVAAKQAE